MSTVSSAVGGSVASTPSGASTSVWRTCAMETPWVENSAATWASTPWRSATRSRTWYRVETSPIGATGRAA